MTYSSLLFPSYTAGGKVGPAPPDTLEPELVRIARDDHRCKDLRHVLPGFLRQGADAVQVPEVALLDRIAHPSDPLFHSRRTAIVGGQRQHYGAFRAESEHQMAQQLACRLGRFSIVETRIHHSLPCQAV